MHNPTGLLCLAILSFCYFKVWDQDETFIYIVFSVDLVLKEEMNLVLKVLRLLVKVWRVELGGTDSLSQILRLANFID